MSKDSNDSEASEGCVLAAIMQQPEKSATKLIDKLTDDVFFYEMHIGLFRALSQLVKEGGDITVDSILDRLPLVSDGLERADEDYVQKLMDKPVKRVNGHLNLVLDLSQGRRLKEAVESAHKNLKGDIPAGTVLADQRPP